MCLAVPLRLLRIDPNGREGIVDMGGAPRTVGLDLVPEAVPGDFILVHAGMGIEVIAEDEAQTTLEALREFAALPGMLAPGAGHDPGKK